MARLISGLTICSTTQVIDPPTRYFAAYDLSSAATGPPIPEHTSAFDHPPRPDHSDTRTGYRDILLTIISLRTRIPVWTSRHASRHVGPRRDRRPRQWCASRTGFHFSTVPRRYNSRERWPSGYRIWTWPVGFGCRGIRGLLGRAQRNSCRCHSSRVSTCNEGLSQELGTRACRCLGLRRHLGELIIQT